MKIDSFSVKNVMSYKDLTSFELDSRLNILIGPNGGGKSNAQRILTVLLTKFFLPQWSFQRPNTERSSITMADNWEVTQIATILDKYIGDNSDQEIGVVMRVEESDIRNMKLIADNIQELKNRAGPWRDKTINALSTEQIEAISAAKTFKYAFLNCQAVSCDSEPQQNYLSYLQNFFKIARLADEIDGMDLRSPIFFFSSTRASGSNFSAGTNEFTSDQYYSQYQSIYSAATGGETNLIAFATRHFGRLMWRAILKAGEVKTLIADEIFDLEPDVILVKDYLRKLGYDWKLVPADKEKMSFNMEFYKNNLVLSPEKFSSGEREIFHFLFAAFALNVEHGVIIIDEPELHLHPRWQRIFLELFYDLSDSKENQFILATHSPQFVTPRTIGSVTRIFERDRVSNKASLAAAQLPNKQHLVRIVNSHNNERLFFADEVVLVEGISDRLVLTSLIQSYSTKAAINRTIEVVEVNGKQNFAGYKELCEGVNMPAAIVGDRDYLREVGDEKTKGLFVTDGGKTWKILRNKKGKDGNTLCKALEAAIKNKSLGDLRLFWDYLRTRGASLNAEMSADEQAHLIADIKALREVRTYVLEKGEIEDYLPDGCSEIAQIIELTSNPNWYLELEDKEKARELNDVTCMLLGIGDEQAKAFRDEVG
ncbi:MAG TPA: AAA family ATPase [Woeseiaceae bacterium]|nr:AAA family ATPase [Woeseiaceae bacterium]